MLLRLSRSLYCRLRRAEELVGLGLLVSFLAFAIGVLFSVSLERALKAIVPSEYVSYPRFSSNLGRASRLTYRSLGLGGDSARFTTTCCYHFTHSVTKVFANSVTNEKWR